MIGAALDDGVAGFEVNFFGVEHQQRQIKCGKANCHPSGSGYHAPNAVRGVRRHRETGQ
jgi:hypothetical protein